MVSKLVFSKHQPWLTVSPDKLGRANPNLTVLTEWKKRMDEVLNRFSEVQAVTQQRDDMKKHHDDLRKKRLDEFMTGFSAISLKLKEMYQVILCSVRLAPVFTQLDR